MKLKQQFILTYRDKDGEEQVEEVRAFNYDQAWFFVNQTYTETDIIDLELAVCRACF